MPNENVINNIVKSGTTYEIQDARIDSMHEVFMISYNETSWSDIVAHYNAGDTLKVKRTISGAVRIYDLTARQSDGVFIFTSSMSTGGIGADVGYLYTVRISESAGVAVYTNDSQSIGKKVAAGTGISIDNSGTSSVISCTAAGPDDYIKSASVSGNTLTLVDQDDTSIEFTPQGGSGSGYDPDGKSIVLDDDNKLATYPGGSGYVTQEVIADLPDIDLETGFQVTAPTTAEEFDMEFFDNSVVFSDYTAYNAAELVNILDSMSLTMKTTKKYEDYSTGETTYDFTEETVTLDASDFVNYYWNFIYDEEVGYQNLLVSGSTDDGKEFQVYLNKNDTWSDTFVNAYYTESDEAGNTFKKAHECTLELHTNPTEITEEVTHTIDSMFMPADLYDAIIAKSTVVPQTSVYSGTEIQGMTVDGTMYKFAGGSTVSGTKGTGTHWNDWATITINGQTGNIPQGAQVDDKTIKVDNQGKLYAVYGGGVGGTPVTKTATQNVTGATWTSGLSITLDSDLLDIVDAAVAGGVASIKFTLTVDNDGSTVYETATLGRITNEPGYGGSNVQHSAGNWNLLVASGVWPLVHGRAGDSKFMAFPASGSTYYGATIVSIAVEASVPGVTPIGADFIPVDNSTIVVNNGKIEVPALPTAPTSDGNYVLKCSVADGVATYSWEVEA